jgi:hypothetical protein
LTSSTTDLAAEATVAVAADAVEAEDLGVGVFVAGALAVGLFATGASETGASAAGFFPAGVFAEGAFAAGVFAEGVGALAAADRGWDAVAVGLGSDVASLHQWSCETSRSQRAWDSLRHSYGRCTQAEAIEGTPTAVRATATMAIFR